MTYPTNPAFELFLVNPGKWERKIGAVGEEKDGLLLAVVIESPTNQANIWYEWVHSAAINQVVFRHEIAFLGGLPSECCVELRPVNKP